MHCDSLTLSRRKMSEPVIRGLSLSIPAGTKVGICGRSGRCVLSFTLHDLHREADFLDRATAEKPHWCLR